MDQRTTRATTVRTSDTLIVTHVIAAGGERIPVAGGPAVITMDVDQPVPFLPVGIVVTAMTQHGEEYATVTIPPIARKAAP